MAILDSGIDSSHPDLAGKVTAARDFVDATGDTSDASWHGTAVAGIVAGDGATDTFSVCPGCVIISGKVLDGQDSGGDAEIARGVLWAVGSGARVVNLSMSGDSRVVRTAGGDRHGESTRSRRRRGGRQRRLDR